MCSKNQVKRMGDQMTQTAGGKVREFWVVDKANAISAFNEVLGKMDTVYTVPGGGNYLAAEIKPSDDFLKKFNPIHVIEKSAYEALERERDSLREQLNNPEALNAAINEKDKANFSRYMLTTKVEQLTKERDELKARLIAAKTLDSMLSDNGEIIELEDETEKLRELLALSIQLMSRPQRGMLDSLFAKAAELGLELEMVRE
jgi:hypothetical protein